MTREELEDSTGRFMWQPPGGKEPITGTAFLISPRYLLTCQHCVKDVASVSVHFPQFKPEPITIQCRVIWIDQIHDVAALVAEEAVPTLTAMELGADPTDGDAWTAFGFPDVAPRGTRIHGNIQRIHHATSATSVKHLRMHCEQGNGKLDGMSGSPVLIAGKVVGIVVEDRALNAVHAVPIRYVREAIADLANATKAWGDRCGASAAYVAARNSNIIKRERSKDTSNLFCLVLSVENALMRSVKEHIDAIPRKLSLDGVDQIVCWSLLGSRELLIQVRAPDPQATMLLKQIVDDCKGIINSTAEWIDIFREYAVVTPLSNADQTELEPVRIRAMPIMKYQMSRAIKVFIYLTTSRSVIPVEQERYSNEVLNRVGKFREIVELIAFSRDAHHIVVELSLPCGRFDELMTLTATMEDGFGRDDFVKSTFLAYDVSQLWPIESAKADDASVSARETGKVA
jgi:hypothetical protein